MLHGGGEKRKMVYVGIIGTENHFDFYSAPFTFYEKEKISITENEEAKTERIFAYALLHVMHREIFGSDIFEIEENEHGKPHEKNSPYDFSISHSHGRCAVAISDVPGELVGVDIQKNVTDEKRIERISKRFLKEKSPRGLSDDIEFKAYFYDLEVGTYKKTEIEIKDCEEVFTAEWTSLEAYLKRLGTGFRHLNKMAEVNKMAEDVRIKSFAFEDYTVSVCK